MFIDKRTLSSNTTPGSSNLTTPATATPATDLNGISEFVLRSSADSPFLPPSYKTIPARISYPPSPSARPGAIRSISAMSWPIPAPTVSTVTISYTELKDPIADILEKVELGFGPNGLGILSISDKLQPFIFMLSPASV
ncbi:hypothetical protein CDL12_02933 [Handroanthus impetiginosus]|uniref:Uncharacterized protein n=1 Tax=Handroanthus impetiginosus TaxID=429701 RepID=A0A2G9I3J7_9LAMI|nr:hypothetical protein CDL12_02933 [Handroanthus impetiginosus]